MRKSLRWFGATAAALLLAAANAGVVQAAGLSFGVFPQLSVRVLVETYQPLAAHLSESLKQPVNLESAADFTIFHMRTVGGEYDLVLTAPHLAWKEGNYRPILIFEEPAKGYVVVRADSTYRQLKDLRGGSIATPDPNAIIKIRLDRDLAKTGLVSGRDIKMTSVGSHTNAATYVVEKQADAALVGIFPFLRLPKDVRDGLRIIAETDDLPSHVFLVHPRTSPESERAISQAIESFMLGENGKAFLKKMGFGGVRPLKKNELKQVEGDALELKRRIQVQESSSGKPN